MALACAAVQCRENKRIREFLRLGTAAQAKAMLLRLANCFLYPDHTRNGVNATQKSFVLRGSHHFWCGPPFWLTLQFIAIPIHRVYLIDRIGIVGYGSIKRLSFAGIAIGK